MNNIARTLFVAASLAGIFPMAAKAQAQPAIPAASASAPVSASGNAEPSRRSPCRAISAEMRTGGPYTREAVVRELVRARAEGEMDFYISTTPPALQRPICPLP